MKQINPKYQYFKQLRKAVNYSIELCIDENSMHFLFTEFIDGTQDLHRSFESLGELNTFLSREYSFLKPIGKDTRAGVRAILNNKEP